MRSLYCLRCKLGWTECGVWPKRCPYRGCSSKHIIPGEEA